MRMWIALFRSVAATAIRSSRIRKNPDGLRDGRILANSATRVNHWRFFAMLIARVIGTLVSTRKEPTIEGLRLLICQPVNADGEKAGAPVVAADAVGAGVGEMILYASGSSARQTVATQNRPVDAVIMAIVDNWEVAGEYKYRKSDDI